jgi:hypothetical protein
MDSELRHQLALQLLSVEPWTDQRRRDVVASVLLILVPSFEVLDRGLNGIDERHAYTIDPKLITDLYEHCPAEQKLALACTTAFCRLAPVPFRRLFLDAWARPMSIEQREALVSTLAAFFSAYPERAEEYRSLILELLWSPRRYLALAALRMVGYLNDLAPRDLERIKARVSGKWFDHRMNGLNGLCELVKRHREVSPAVVAFATSPELRAIARRIQRTDPDKDARTCAYYLLKAIREYDARGTKAKKPPRRAHRR